MPDLTMDGDSNSPTQPTAAKAEDSDNDDDDDEIIEMKVKSQDTVIRERFNRAQAAGNVHSIACTSIRATFQSISSTVTAMRGGANRVPLQERQITLEQNGRRSQMVRFSATRMVLNSNGDGMINAPGEKSDERAVSIAMQPFAQGGLRNVFRMTEARASGLAALVGKESRHEVHYNERLRFHLETSRCQAQAADYGNKFNKAMSRTKATAIPGVQKVKVLRAEVYRLKDPSFPRGHRYLAVEEEMKGKYEKYNSNQGFVLQSDTPESHVAQAFRYVFRH